MTHVLPIKKLSIKPALKLIFCPLSRCFEKIYRKNKIWRVAMTTIYTNTYGKNSCMLGKRGVAACMSS